MDLPTIEMDEAEAAEKLAAYEATRPDRLTEDDRATMAGYAAIADGLTLIDLVAAMRDAGLGDDFRPRLAIARADVRAVRFEGDRAGGGVFYPHRSGARDKPTSRMRVRIPDGTFSWPRGFEPSHLYIAVAWTPTIPPEHRPAPSRLRDHHILWEAEWKPNPPGDPFLLKHLAGTLYVVLAQWDLTPVEQAVMRRRMVEER